VQLLGVLELSRKKFNTVARPQLHWVPDTCASLVALLQHAWPNSSVPPSTEEKIIGSIADFLT
jgi:hypothetical protein